MNENMATVIREIMQNHPDQDRAELARKALPGVDEDAIAATIEIFSGGDLRVIEADGTERGDVAIDVPP